MDGPSGSRVPHRSPAMTRPPWTTASGCPPRARPTIFFNFFTGKTDQDTGLRKHQGRGAGFCLSGREADTWAGLHIAREQRACAPAPAGAMPWCWPCRCWWHWPPSRVAALALVTAFPALGLINIVSIYWHDYCGLQYLCHACMIAFAYVVALEADLALLVLVEIEKAPRGLLCCQAAGGLIWRGLFSLSSGCTQSLK